MESPLIVLMFYSIVDPTLALYRIFPAGHQYLHDMHFFHQVETMKEVWMKIAVCFAAMILV